MRLSSVSIVILLGAQTVENVIKVQRLDHTRACRSVRLRRLLVLIGCITRVTIVKRLIHDYLAAWTVIFGALWCHDMASFVFTDLTG